MISVAEAEARIIANVAAMAAQTVSLAEAHGRTLAAPLVARRTHPPRDVSSMDGYALAQADAPAAPVTLPVAFRIQAGETPPPLPPGSAARLFTGAAMPDGADTVVIQEDTSFADGRVTITEAPRMGQHVRKAGYDIAEGATLLPAGTRLAPAHIALAAAAGHATLCVHARPRIAFLATGDELVPPGIVPEGVQIVASTGLALAALVERWGGAFHDLGIARDDEGAIRDAARGGLDADILVTQGGASVGDADLVKPALAPLGLDVDFWKIAMRPGKPLMAGRIGGTRVLGLPGNPVSALVCATLFLQPLVRTLAGEAWTGQRLATARLAAPLKANDQRQDYLRARLDGGAVTAFPLQDSGNLSTYARANALIVRPPHAPTADTGDLVQVLAI
ncbi:MAG: molybdopterin molybdotransferase MoeA [Micropepsaceae bacterium]